MVGFIVGGALFSISFYFALESAVRIQEEPLSAEESNYSAIAASLADVLLSRGEGWYSAAPCLPDGKVDDSKFSPEGVGALDGSGKPLGRIGLRGEGCEVPTSGSQDANNLSYEKISNLFRAGHSRDPANGFVDYEEAEASLGLEDHPVDFHLRSWPVLASASQILRTGAEDPYLRPLYLANYLPGATPPARPIIQVLVTVREDLNNAYVDLTAINDGIPTISSPFQASFAVALERGTVTWTQNLLEIPALGSGLVTAQFSKTTDWSWKDAGDQFVSWTVSDSVGPLASGAASLAGIDMTAPLDGSTHLLSFVSLDRLLYQEPFGPSNNWPEATYSGYNGKGQKQASFDGGDVDLKVLGVGVGPLLYARTYTDPSKNGQSLEDASLDVGVYRVELWTPDGSGTIAGTDQFQILSSLVPGGCNVDPGDYVPSDGALEEATHIDALFRRFDRYAARPEFASPPDLDYAAVGGLSIGDVYPDIKCAMNVDLPQVLLDDAGTATLAKYTTLIVGSDVDQGAMTSLSARDAIRDWVQAGGTLIVFGSDEQTVEWLQPLFDSSIVSAGGALYTPDAQHPILRVPNALDYDSFLFTSAWEYSLDAETKFTHVVTSAGGGDLLSFGNPGAFGEGRVVLTSWKPSDLVVDEATACPSPLAPDSPCQPLYLLQNVALQSYRELFLDYGPSVPDGASAGTEMRIANVYEPHLGEVVTLSLQIVAFPGG